MPDENPNTSMPKIVPDKDDLRSFHNPRNEPVSASNDVPGNKSSASLWLFLVFVVAATSCGINYWLHTQYLAQNTQLVEAQQRLSHLEQRLSTTGQEMDQSAVALQVKVTELTKKAEELWGQMDKLWASAWRRNQSEIKALTLDLEQTNTQSNKKLAGITRELNIAATNLEFFREQLDTQQATTKRLNRSVERFKGTSADTNQLVLDLQKNLAATKKQSQTLKRQINALEKWRRSVESQLNAANSSLKNSSIP